VKQRSIDRAVSLRNHSSRIDRIGHDPVGPGVLGTGDDGALREIVAGTEELDDDVALEDRHAIEPFELGPHRSRWAEVFEP
jgi:hypothetical protein